MITGAKKELSLGLSAACLLIALSALIAMLDVHFLISCVRSSICQALPRIRSKCAPGL